MRAALDRLRGRRDFACFQSSGSPRRSTVRTLAGLRLAQEGGLLRMDAVADGFLYGMVRAIAGTVAEVGRGARPPEDLDALLASRDRRRAGPAAPAHGLALVAVGYAGDPAPAFVDPSLRADLESGRTRRPEPNPPTQA
jgi:tRNA pseudouridine38-40 synthase